MATPVPSPAAAAALSPPALPRPAGDVGACPVRSAQVAHPLVAPVEGSCPRANNEPVHSQAVHPEQRLPLSTHRVVSSIPKTEVFTPAHQPADAPHWSYPSEQMFYNALRRKGYDARDEDIPAVVAIHNAVNEMAWSKVRAWEAMHERHVPCARFVARRLLCVARGRAPGWLGAAPVRVALGCESCEGRVVLCCVLV